MKLGKAVGTMLHLIGVNPKMHGYTYLRWCIIRYHVKNKEYRFQSLCKTLLPDCGRAYGTNWNAVERSCRSALNNAGCGYSVVEFIMRSHAFLEMFDGDDVVDPDVFTWVLKNICKL